MIRSTFRAAAAVLLLPLASAAAQDPAPAAPAQPAPFAGATSSVFGVVYDSVRNQPMAGALVRVDSTQLVSVTDAEGRFQIAGIPPGTHYLRVDHPLLDTIGVGLRTGDLELRAGEGTVHQLATPRSSVLVERFCSSAWRARGPAALMGRVREADTGVPAEGARVSLVFYDSTGGKPVPRVREAQVGPDGRYRICGLPENLEAKLQVIRAPLTSGDISISFGDDVLGLRSLTIASPMVVAAVPPSDSAAPAAAPVVIGNARLRGRVINRAGQPIAGARVMLEGTTFATTSAEDGTFSLDSLPPGTQSVAVRKLGYSPTDAGVELSSRGARAVTIAMDDYVPTLETVRVTAERDRALRDVGFARRQRLGTGFYMEGDQINKESLNFTDILRNVPGLRISYGAGGQYVESTRGMSSCVAFWIDGTMWQQLEPGDIDDFVRAQEVEAIEVYSPTQTPTEYQGRSAGCTTVLVWTARRLEPKRRTP